MKIQELREHIANQDKAELELIVVEMYKALPKKAIEEKEIDQLIANPSEFVTTRKRVRTATKDVVVDTDVLKIEIEQFISNAKAQNYFAPNRVISKKERPKWRFLVKRFVDQLIIAARQTENQAEAARLLEDLYKLLCQACGVYLFSTENPFRSVGISQVEFYGKVLRLKQQVQPAETWIGEGISLLAEHDLDSETLPTYLMDVFQEFVHTPPLRQAAVGACTVLLEKKETLYRKKAQAWAHTSTFSSSYGLQNQIQNLAKLLFRLHQSLFEEGQAIAAFTQHYVESNPEVKAYVLLQLLRQLNRKDAWMREYENAVREQVKLRDELVRTHEFLLHNGEFPGTY